MDATQAGVVAYPVELTERMEELRRNAGAKALPYASGVVTFLFHENGRNEKDKLNGVIDEILVYARELGVQLTKGVSFGYSVPRLWVQEITDDDPWFLRLNVGDRGHQIDLLAEAVIRAVLG
jgi:hypothetical protein